MTEKISMESASQVLREGMREVIKKYSYWYMVQGGTMIVTGVFAFIYPLLARSSAVVLVGWLLIVSALVQGASLIGARHVPHFWVQLVSIVLSVIIGIMFLRSPDQGMFTLTMLLIIYFLAEGISKVIFALSIRPFPNWYWVLGSGMVGFMAAAFSWSKLPVTAIWILCPLLGITLISEGAAIGYMAWQYRKSIVATDTPT